MTVSTPRERRAYLQGYRQGIESVYAAIPCEFSNRCRCPPTDRDPCGPCEAYHRIVRALSRPQHIARRSA